MTKRKIWTLIVSVILILGCIWFTFYYANGLQKDTVKFQDGTVYQGTTENGKLRSGVMHFNNGDTYTGAFKGQFHHGVAQGNGQLMKKGKVIQSGKYERGVYVKQ